MIELNHVYKTYSGTIHALKNIDLKIDAGEFVFLTGPSGAGKSTLFRLISAFDRVTSGSIIVNDHDLSRIDTLHDANKVAAFRRRIGVVYQDFKLLREETVFDNVALPLRIRNERESIIEKKVLHTLEQVGLADKFDQYPDFMSGGEQQRTAIARAIIHQPAILVADEPTGNLDPELAEEIMNVFERVATQGTTVFIATHDHDMVDRRNKRRIHIENGELLDGRTRGFA